MHENKWHAWYANYSALIHPFISLSKYININIVSRAYSEETHTLFFNYLLYLKIYRVYHIEVICKNKKRTSIRHEIIHPGCLFLHGGCGSNMCRFMLGVTSVGRGVSVFVSDRLFLFRWFFSDAIFGFFFLLCSVLCILFAFDSWIIVSHEWCALWSTVLWQTVKSFFFFFF